MKNHFTHIKYENLDLLQRFINDKWGVTINWEQEI